MPRIFINYRRIDTQPWAGRLYADLRMRFGAQVFMDIDGIQRGVDFEQVLKNELSSCDVLLVLIGPDWVQCKRKDGRRRLDVEDDWVRTEIATALHRNISIIPILFGDTKCPVKDELPEDLYLLCNHNAARVRDTQWDYDTRELFKDLVRRTSKKPIAELDITSATNGLYLLKDWMSETAIADAIIRSKEVIERTYLQLSKLELYKIIHDALHSIEFECLRPMEAGISNDPLRLFNKSFTIQAQQIKEVMLNPDMDSLLREEIEDQISIISDAFHSALNDQGVTTTKEVLIGELKLLLSSFPERLNSEIVRSAAELNLDRIVELMTKVKEMLPEQEASFTPIIQGIEALQGLRDELKLRVDEHNRLQSLDRELRRGCVGGSTARTLASEWRRIKQVRARLVPPFTSALESSYDDLTEIESEIEAAVEQGENPVVQPKMIEYFRLMGFVFRNVDNSLKNFCMRLSRVSQPLKTLLDSC